MLGDAVARSFELTWPQEIFNDAFADPDVDYLSATDLRVRANFFNFRHQLLRERPELSYPSETNQLLLWQKYIENLGDIPSGIHYLLDVKYSSWHHLDEYWKTGYSEPGLLRFIAKLDLPVVHLRRANVFAQYCSQIYAETTGIWAKTDKKRGRRRKIRIDTGRCLKHMSDVAARAERVRGWLRKGRYWELEYEKLLVDSQFSSDVVDTFSEVFGNRPAVPLKTRYKKVTPPLQQVIANGDEVLERLEGTPFLAMAEEALGNK